MKLPNADRAIILPEKLRDYLLSAEHPSGRHKARFFRRLGYRQEHWAEFRQALREQHLSHDAEELEPNAFGRRFQIISPMTGPSGETAIIKSIWIVLTGEDVPRFVSAYPE
jgi:hypothetical protein